jgi:hypothetical protein
MNRLFTSYAGITFPFKPFSNCTTFWCLIQLLFSWITKWQRKIDNFFCCFLEHFWLSLSKDLWTRTAQTQLSTYLVSFYFPDKSKEQKKIGASFWELIFICTFPVYWPLAYLRIYVAQQRIYFYKKKLTGSITS